MTELPTPCRRTVLCAAGAASVIPALAACGGSGSGSEGGEVSPAPEGTSGTDSGGSDGGSGGGEALARTSDIPEGGGKVFPDRKVVVTQPEPGTFKAYSAVCTHQGCVVKDVTDGMINCTCHGSSFAIADGSVQGGPAPKPLEERPVTVQGQDITLG